MQGCAFQIEVETPLDRELLNDTKHRPQSLGNAVYWLAE